MTRKLPVLETEFEIIDRYICSHRFKTAEYWWAWRPKSGTVDETDYSMVDVFVRRTGKLIEQLEAADSNFDQSAPGFSFPFPADKIVPNLAKLWIFSEPFHKLLRRYLGVRR